MTVLRTITLPLLDRDRDRGVLIFVLTLGTFAVPQVIGAPAGFSTITTRIYADLALGSNPQSFVRRDHLAVLLMAITLIIVTPADRLLGGRLSLSRTSARASDWGTGSRTPRILVPIVLGLYLIFTCGLPLVALVSAAFTRAVGVALSPGNWTLDNFLAVLTPRTGRRWVAACSLPWPPDPSCCCLEGARRH